MKNTVKSGEELTPSPYRVVSREKFFHVWQLANQPKYSKHWGFVSHCKRFVDAFDAYDETAANSDEQFKGLVALVDEIVENRAEYIAQI